LNLVALVLLTTPVSAFAEEMAHGADSGKGIGLIGAAIAIGLAALGGTLAQGRAVSSGLEAIGRNPGAKGSLFVPMILGLVFLESLVIMAFVIAFLIQGKV
jgi:F-type H+-transporting ATPase subunit c